ncbi:MAG: mobile mystery protein A [Janthinobacterium lividum]
MRNGNLNAVARQHLDARVNNTSSLETLHRPPLGWIKAIREALGMTTAQLAQRLGVSQPAVVILERSEALSRIRLDTLERAAAALDCHLVYALVPNQPLEVLVQSRRYKIAEGQLAAVEQSMKLENQSIEDKETRQRHLSAIADKLDPRILWNEL